MRILLTGGTGFLGKVLSASLSARGDEVVVVSRRGPVTWDDVEREVPRAGAVVHLAGEPIAEGRWTEERWERIRSSRLDTTARLARALAAAASAASDRPPVFVSCSAIGIYGMRRDDVLCDESSGPGEDVLARLCVAWERAADAARDAGVRVVHPRIGIALGGGGVLARMAPAFRLFAGGPVGDGTQWVSWIHARDVVRALLFLLDGESLSGAYDLVAPHPVTMTDLARAIGKQLRRPSALAVPAFALRLAFGEGLAETLLTGQRVAPRRLLEAGFAFDFPDLGPALADLLG
jgi:uncharacterized protein (TIGR01777 family)